MTVNTFPLSGLDCEPLYNEFVIFQQQYTSNIWIILMTGICLFSPPVEQSSNPAIKISFFIPKNYITHTVEPLILCGSRLSVRMDLF